MMMSPRSISASLLLLLGATSVSGFEVAGGGPQWTGGAGVGRLVLDDKMIKEGAVQCHYDMVLVERIQGKPKTESGLFVPDEDQPRLHLCKVLSMGSGREEENGIVAPMPEGMKVGDIVIAKNPWGIGPKDEETPDGKKLSFMRSQDIAAIIEGGLLPEED
mmetsp:Transcript_18341/g.25870  ORF Transcript_18341/g.25870 Transcript_18341/m.25870 type:complete len:161 (-) Transcript_18341:193-675(-)